MIMHFLHNSFCLLNKIKFIINSDRQNKKCNGYLEYIIQTTVFHGPSVLGLVSLVPNHLYVKESITLVPNISKYITPIQSITLTLNSSTIFIIS